LVSVSRDSGWFMLLVPWRDKAREEAWEAVKIAVTCNWKPDGSCR